jgi:homoserine O-acetyltransferase
MAVITFPTSKYYQYDGEFKLDLGDSLSSFTLAYETFGKLNSDKSNAILIFHALSGSAHVTKTIKDFEENSGLKGWWENMVGPDKPFDTKKYFIICANVLGSCYGSTGPSSINSENGEQYALDFPILTINDMVKSQKFLIDFLGIEKLLTVTGGSMGGMQALDWVLLYPQTVKSVIPISTPPQSSSQNIAFHEVGRQAIMSDPNWNEGKYYEGNPPNLGLQVARMVGHITYLSDVSMRNKFGRRLQSKNGSIPKFHEEFEVESYLSYKGTSFTKRFDANSYLYLTKSMDYFDLYSNKLIEQSIKKNEKYFEQLKCMILSFSSDWLYPPQQSRELANFLKKTRIPVSYCQIDSDYGHDAFLVDVVEQSDYIRDFLSNLL